MRHDGFHGRAGFGQRPALVVVDVNVGFTDPESPLEPGEEALARVRDGDGIPAPGGSQQP